MPAISITLRLDEPSIKGPGYQPPDLTSPPVLPIAKKPKFKKFTPKPKDRDDYPFPKNQKPVESKYKPKKEGAEAGKPGRQRNGRQDQKKSGEKKPKRDRHCEEFKPSSTETQSPAGTVQEAVSNSIPSDNNMDCTNTVASVPENLVS